MTDFPGAASRAPAPDRAYCAVHPSNPAIDTCSRCGNYVCRDCLGEGGDTMCAPCRSRLGIDQFPFNREQWEVGGLVSHAWNAFQKNWGALLLMSLVVFVLPMVAGFMLGIFGAFLPAQAKLVFTIGLQGFQMLTSVVFTLGALSMLLDAVRGRPLGIDSFMRGVKRVGAGLVQYVLMILAFALAVALVVTPVLVGHGHFAWISAVLGVVLVVPGIYVMLGLAFMWFELVHDPACGPIEAFGRSWEIARGQRLAIFGTMLVGGLIMLAGVVLCGVGMLASYPIGMMVTTGLYLALRDGSGLPEPAER